jgi:hypothetical protein
MLLISCGPEIVVDFDCGEVDTEIRELDEVVGTYNNSNFTNTSSSNFEQAAIAVNVGEVEITSETETSCFAYTALPQLIESIKITSSNTVASGGIEFLPGQDLIELFQLHSNDLTFSISEFITAQNTEPILFGDEGAELFLQLLDKPDISISQSFEIEFNFTDLQIVSAEVAKFEVLN